MGWWLDWKINTASDRYNNSWDSVSPHLGERWELLLLQGGVSYLPMWNYWVVLVLYESHTCAQGCMRMLSRARVRPPGIHSRPLSSTFTLQCLPCNNGHRSWSFCLFTVNMMICFVSRGHWRKAFLPGSSWCDSLLLSPAALPIRAFGWKHLGALPQPHTQSMSPLLFWLGPRDHLCGPPDIHTVL